MKPTPDLERIFAKLDMIFNEVNTVEQYTLLKIVMWKNKYIEGFFKLSSLRIGNFSHKLENNFKAKFKLSSNDMRKIRNKISSGTLG